MNLRQAINVFCPTGEGGGIDPTCSPNSEGRGEASGKSLKNRLVELKSKLAEAAQQEYDSWQQDEEGMDCEVGSGGICDGVADRMASVLAEAGLDVTEGGQDGDDHAWLIAYDETEAYGVDIPPGVYETGGGYNWTKIPDVKITADDVEIFKVDRDVIGEEEYGSYDSVSDDPDTGFGVENSVRVLTMV